MNEEIEKMAKEIVSKASELAKDEGYRLNILRSKKGLLPLWGEEKSIKPFIIPLIKKAILQAKKETYEECAKLCDVASKPKVILSKDFHTTTIELCLV